MKNTRGKFIVFEGISGTGKETQAKLLQSYLAERQIQSRIVYHPTPEGKELLTHWRHAYHADNEIQVYLLMADRVRMVHQVIRPALSEGVWVISLRSYVSALVYQAEDPADREWIRTAFSRFEPAIDLQLFFDLDPTIAFTRINRRHEETGEAIGSFETLPLLTEMRRRYEAVLSDIPHIRVDAGKSKAQLAADIRTHFARL